MRKHFFVFATLALGFLLSAAELPLSKFMERARNPNSGSTFAALSGQIQHRRAGGKVENASLYFAVIIQPERSTGQIIIDGSEGYLIGQTRLSGDSETTVTPMVGSQAQEAARLGYMGIRPSDLTMSFLYYTVVRELEPVTLSGIAPCRVVLLETPDKSEQVRVYISRDHYFPLKAEFIKAGEKEPYRTLETSGFTKKNDLYYCSKINLDGPGWRTRITFDGDEAKLGVFDAARPPQIIRRLK